LVVTAFSLPGCYLGHLACGQLRLLSAREPIQRVVAAPETSPLLRGQLALVEEVREFAAQLGLEVDGNYTSYVPWEGDRVVTTLVAAEPGSVEPREFWFPLVGRVPYKGYFDQSRAEAEAEKLRAQKLDVCVVAVPAYSTLGWFDDPVTGPMLRSGEGRLVETLLHELVHATVFLPDAADFNEGVATFIGEEASVRFYAAQRSVPAAAAAARQREVEDGRRYDDALLAFRSQVEALYSEPETHADRAERRAQAEQEARRGLASLPLATRDPAALAQAARLNDACLALAATYTADLPDYERVLAELGGDLGAFVSRLRAAGESDDPRGFLLGTPSEKATASETAPD